MSKLEEKKILIFSHYFQPFIEFSPSLFGPLLCSPTFNFLIFRKNINKNSAQITHFEPSRFRHGPFGRTASSPGLQTQKPGPGPGKWPPRTGLFGPWGEPAAARRWMPSNGSQHVRAEQNRRPPARPANPNSFSPLLLSFLSTGGCRRAEGDGVGDAVHGGGGGGAVELCSPEVRAAAAGVQLRRAPLVGALILASWAREIHGIRGGGAGPARGQFSGGAQGGRPGTEERRGRSGTKVPREHSL